MFTKIITAKTFLWASFIIKGWRRTKNLEPPKIIYHPHHLICVQLRKMPKKQITHFLLQIIHFNVSLWYLPWTFKSLLFLVVEIWNDGWNKWWQYCAKVKLFLLAFGSCSQILINISVITSEIIFENWLVLCRLKEL